MITIYSSPSCMKCKVLKNWCDKNKTEYTSVDITEDSAAYDLLTSKGLTSLPVVSREGAFYSGDVKQLIEVIGMV